MPSRSLRAAASGKVFDEVNERLPLFENLPSDAIQRLTASGYGRGFLTASLRARLRKAGYGDLGRLAQTSPEAIAGIRKFGPVRIERVRSFILTEIARWMPGVREGHTAGATADSRLGRLRGVPVERLPLDADALAGLGLVGRSCADLAGRSRLELLGAGVTARDVDRLVTTLALFLEGDRATPPSSVQAAAETPAAEAEARAARRASLLAQQDREWEDAAPASGR